MTCVQVSHGVTAPGRASRTLQQRVHVHKAPARHSPQRTEQVGDHAQRCVRFARLTAEAAQQHPGGNAPSCCCTAVGSRRDA